MDRLDGQNLKPRSGDLGGSAAIYPFNHSLRCGVSLAPIAGFTNAACRLMATHGGADLTYTEMVSAAGLAHGSSPTRHLLEVLPGEGAVACQLFGSKPDELASSVREVSALGRFVEINLNAGCPVPRIVKEGAGSALVRKPELVHKLLSAMVAETDLPVTLKTRPGPRPDTVLMLELLDAAESAGAKGFILHARFTAQNHGGPVHLDLLAELVRKARIPVTGNGGVADVATFSAMAETGVASIMIGRAAISNPYLFAVLKGMRREDIPDPTSLFRRHVDALVALHGQISARFPNDRLPTLDAWVTGAVRTHLFRYFSGMPGAAELRRNLAVVCSIGSMMESVNAFSGFRL